MLAHRFVNHVWKYNSLAIAKARDSLGVMADSLDIYRLLLPSRHIKTYKGCYGSL